MHPCTKLSPPSKRRAISRIKIHTNFTIHAIDITITPNNASSLHVSTSRNLQLDPTCHFAVIETLETTPPLQEHNQWSLAMHTTKTYAPKRGTAKRHCHHPIHISRDSPGGY
jgi:hypothetical protein